MKSLQFDDNAFLASPESKHFIMLGTKKLENKDYVDQEILKKINKQSLVTNNELWGTLGLANDSKIEWSGNLEISELGNNDFQGTVKEEVELIKSCYPQLDVDNGSDIIERFINFDDVLFNLPDNFTLSELPKLRLDLMLNQDQGAVVFYQYQKENTDETIIEYIQPEATDNNNVNERDRLKYFFDIVHRDEIIPVDDMPGLYELKESEEKLNHFIIKCIVFKRSSETFSLKKSSDAIEMAMDKIKGLVKEPKLLCFDVEANDFVAASKGMVNVDAKTLLLIHGTFSNTEGSYDKLYGKNGSWLKSLMNPANDNAYQQILAFDHPTVFDDAEGNINSLFEILNQLDIAQFNSEVDLIGTSQGGLIAQYLANYNQVRIPINKVTLVASANGVGYLSAGQAISKFLTALRYIFKLTGQAAQASITSLAQHSVDVVLNLPGLALMTPGNPKLESIMYDTPRLETTRYLPIADFFNADQVSDDQWKVFRFFKRLGAKAIDHIVQPILGEENDWVVGTRNQYMIPGNYCAIENYNPARFRDNMIPSIHGACINLPDTQALIKTFFLDKKIEPSPVSIYQDHYDGHCHIFGNEILTKRILILLLEDILSYIADGRDVKKMKKEDKAKEKQKGNELLKNLLKYIAFNHDSYQMLRDLEKEYDDLNANVYRYNPLMFDLEMSFRNKYSKPESKVSMSPVNDNVEKYMDMFLQKLKDSGVKRKLWKSLERGLKLMSSVMTIDSDKVPNFDQQIKELCNLKIQYTDNMYPFLAVDPRRPNMSEYITKFVGADKPFRGIKLYAPNGYSPTDPHLFDDATAFVDGQSLYSWCIQNNVPIMAHCSNAGFATFADELEVMGDVYYPMQDPPFEHFDKPTKIHFKYNLLHGGFGKAVRERAVRLNHPQLWNKVLAKYPTLTLCLAHFGGEGADWRAEIAQLMMTYPNCYTDLSCITSPERLKTICNEYFSSNNKISDKIMYGSDFFLNMLGNISFETYYNQFKDAFSEEQLYHMSCVVTERYLSVSHVKEPAQLSTH